MFWEGNFEHGKVDIGSGKTLVFRDTDVDSLFTHYRDRFKLEANLNSSYVIAFFKDTSIVFSQALYVKTENLVGYKRLKGDLLLIYSESEIYHEYLDEKGLGRDSITDFPYWEQLDNLPPFDPIEEKYSLITKQRIDGFKGLGIPEIVIDL